MVGERSNAVTDIMRKMFHMALPKPSSTNVYSLAPDLESEIMPKEAADPESAVIMATELQKEAEINLFSTMLFPPEGRP